MSRLKRLITEIHHRSLWQVLLIYVGAAWACFELIDTVTDRLGLPAWLPGLAIVLFLLALPVVLATAFVREKPAVAAAPPEATDAEAEAAAARHDIRRRHRLLTWRNAVAGFVVALAALGAVATGWLLFGERATPEEVDARKSIAVLPLDNIGGLDENQGFADGIHDDILTHLYKIGDLKVISRTSVLEYRDTRKNLRQIADELGVATVLEGGVRRAGDRVRINVQLIDAETDEHLWAETYEEDLTAENIFAIQTDIAQRIAFALKAELTPEERERIAVRPTENLEAYEYLQAARQHRADDAEGRRVVIRMYERAIELDPDFALAHAELALYSSWTYWAYGRDEDDLARTKLHADKALELDPDLGEVHEALGAYYYRGFRDWEKALEHLAVAAELSPQNGGIYMLISGAQRRMGDWEQALATIEKAAELSPRARGVVEEVPTTHLWMRNYEEAISLFDRSIALDPAYSFSYRFKAWAYLNIEGGVENASRVWDELRDIRGRAEDPNSLWFLGRARLRILHDRYRDDLRQHTLETWSGDTLNYFLAKALSYRLTSEPESAYAYFDSARVMLETREVRSQFHHANLGVIYAGLGRREDAVREGELAVQALPVSKDALEGPLYVASLAEIYVIIGEYDAAIDKLEYLLSITCPISPPLLEVDPVWDPLRDHARFQALLAKYE